jgi:hypothetical protein
MTISLICTFFDFFFPANNMAHGHDTGAFHTSKLNNSTQKNFPLLLSMGVLQAREIAQSLSQELAGKDVNLRSERDRMTKEHEILTELVSRREVSTIFRFFAFNPLCTIQQYNYPSINSCTRIRLLLFNLCATLISFFGFQIHGPQASSAELQNCHTEQNRTTTELANCHQALTSAGEHDVALACIVWKQLFNL